jgi:phosphorylcholine metabolism protein LicD
MNDIKKSIRDLLYNIGIFTPIKNIILLYKKPLARYNTKKLVNPILCKTKKVFDKNCEKYWLDYGTLLGYVRDGKLLPGDDDLDFGVIVKDGIDIEADMKKEDIFLFKRIIVEGKITFEQYRYKGFRFDVFHYQKVDDNITTNMWLPNHYNMPQHIAYKNGECSLSETTFKDFRQTIDIQFYNCTYKIPSDSDSYLAQHYGVDYMIPNPNFTLDDELNRKVVDKEYRVEFYD